MKDTIQRFTKQVSTFSLIATFAFFPLIAESYVNESPVVQTDPVSEKRYAYIRDAKEVDSALFVNVDYVDYLTGDKALEAEWRDEAYFIDGEDTITTITDGYYISNINPKLRTFQVKSGTVVKYIIDDDGEFEMPSPKPLDLEQLIKYAKLETLVILHVEDGVIERIDERFMP